MIYYREHDTNESYRRVDRIGGKLFDAIYHAVRNLHPDLITLSVGKEEFTVSTPCEDYQYEYVETDETHTYRVITIGENISEMEEVSPLPSNEYLEEIDVVLDRWAHFDDTYVTSAFGITYVVQEMD